jgi:hypothetical protein
MPTMLRPDLALGAYTPTPRTFAPAPCARQKKMTIRVLKPLVGVGAHTSAADALVRVTVRAPLWLIGRLCDGGRLGDWRWQARGEFG